MFENVKSLKSVINKIEANFRYKTYKKLVISKDELVKYNELVDMVKNSPIMVLGNDLQTLSDNTRQNVIEYCKKLLFNKYKLNPNLTYIIDYKTGEVKEVKQ